MYISYKKSTAPATQPIRHHHHQEFLLSSKRDLSSKTTHTKFLLLFRKMNSSLLFFGLVYGFSRACLPQIRILYYSQIHPSLAGKMAVLLSRLTVGNGGTDSRVYDS